MIESRQELKGVQMLKSARHLPALLAANAASLKSHVTKRATPGEQVLGKLFPNRGTGYPGGWDSDHIQQVNHMVDWVYVAVHSICMKLASIYPNMAWVTDGNKRQRGVTKRCDQRGLMNAMGIGFGGSSHISSQFRTKPKGDGAWIYDPNYREAGHTRTGRIDQPDDTSNWTDYSSLPSRDGMCGSNSAFLTMGEYRSKALSVVKPHEELEPLENRHLLRQLIDNPNPVDTYFDYTYELNMFKLLCGQAYEWIIPNAFGRPCERWVIPTHWVWPRTGGNDLVDREHPDADRLIQYYEIRPWGGMGSAGMLRLPPDQVIPHIFKSPTNKLLGYSKLWAMSRWIDTEESISKSRWSQFINQARPEFWVEMGAGYVDPDDDMISRWEAKIAQKHQGEANTHKPLFMPAGAKAQVLSFSPEEMGYITSMDQVRDMIFSGFSWPKSAVGLGSEMTFGSVLAMLMQACEGCINPHLTQAGQVTTKHLASRFDEQAPAWSQGTGGQHGGAATTRRCRLWYDNCTPADPAQVNSDLQVDIQAHAITPNEMRVLRGRSSYGLGGDNPMVQGPGGVMPMPINVAEEGDDLTDLVRRYSEAMAADKDATKLGTMESNEDVPAEAVTGKVDAAVVMEEATEDVAGGAKVENPNGKPSKGWSKQAKDLGWSFHGVECNKVTFDSWKASLQKGSCPWCGKTLRNAHNNISKHLQACPERPSGPVSTKTFKSWCKQWTDKIHEFSSTQFNLDGYARNLALTLGNQIDDADLTDKGREMTPHVTIRYGLHTSDAEEVKQLVEAFGPVEIKLGKVDYFPAEDHDVVILQVEGGKLRELNQLLGRLENTQTHAEYNPHVTIAYVKPGMGEVYMDSPQRGLTGSVDQYTNLVFSPREGEPTVIELASYIHQES